MTSKKSFSHYISRLQERSVFRVAGIYAAAGFAVLQLADILLPAFELPEPLISYLAIAIVSGFPVMILVTWFSGSSSDETIANDAIEDTQTTASASHLTAIFSTAVIVAFLVSATGYFWIEQEEQTNANYEDALTQIGQLLDKGRYTDAFLIMRDLDASDDPRRDEYAERIVVPGRPKITEDGVHVSFRPYNKVEVEWTSIGKSPFTDTIPLPRGDLHLKLEAEGYADRELVAKNPGPLFQNSYYLTNIAQGKVHQSPITMATGDHVVKGFQLIPSSDQPVFLSGWSRDVLGRDISANTPEFLVQTYEVSNAQYKQFVSAGGYSNPQYWRDLKFVDEDRQLTFDEAMTKFVDQTGRPGPATWSLSSYGEGERDLPVGGISWYEAVAYARFRNLSLPTIYQWSRYALGPLEGIYPLAGAIEEASHFNAKAPAKVTEKIGLGPWGTFNTAGNVREWVWNDTSQGLGIIQGSSWESYGNYAQVVTAQRMGRHESYGVRLVDNLADSPDPSELASISLVYDDPYTNRDPVSDDAYAVMRVQFAAPDRSIESVKIERLQETDLWQVDEHQLAYTNGEELTVYIFSPVGKGPFRTVLFAPPGSAFRPGSLNRAAILSHVAQFEYILRGGRAVVMPIWANTYERYRTPAADPAEISTRQAQGALQWYLDAVNSINYIEDLPELANDKLTYLAISYGASVFGQLVTALEDRVTNSIFVSGGIVHTTHLNPLLDGINYLPQITKPVLMINGDQDHIFRWKESSLRSYELLGTPEKNKKLIRYSAGHISFSRDRLITDVSDWLDQYASKP